VSPQKAYKRKRHLLVNRRQALATRDISHYGDRKITSVDKHPRERRRMRALG